MAYLKKLPIHELKVDRSFVDGLATDHDDRAIASAIITMAEALGLRVVAEGVENTEQLEVLSQLGGEVAQGFLFSRPKESVDFLTVLRDKIVFAGTGTLC